MRPMIALLFVTLLLVHAPVRAYAATPTADSIERLMEITQSKALLEQSYANLEKNIRQLVLQSMGERQPTDAQLRLLDDLIARMSDLYRQEISWERLHPQFITLYMEAFDQAEIDGMLAFYEGAKGRATIAKMPMVQEKSQAMMQKMLMNLMPKLNALAVETLADMKQLQSQQQPQPEQQPEQQPQPEQQ